MKLLFVLFGLIAVSQASNPVEWLEAEALKEFDTLKGHVIDFSKEVRDTIREVRVGLKEDVQKGLLHIESTFDEALASTKGLPDHCTAGLQQHFTHLKSSFSWDFFKCSNLTLILEEVGEMALDFASTAAKLMVSVNKIMTAPTNCMTWKVWEAVECYVHLISTVKNEVQSDISLVKSLVNDTKILAHEIKDNFQHCLHPDSLGPSPAQKAAAQVLYKVHDCVRTNKPVQLY